MAVRDDWASGEILTATDLNDTVDSKLDVATPTFTGQILAPNLGAAPQYSFTADKDGVGFQYDEGDNAISIVNDYASFVTVAASGAIFGDYGSLGYFYSWTPTFVNWSKGNATTYCGYQQLGRYVFVRFRFDMGSTTTYSGSFQVTGAPAAKPAGFYETGTCAYVDTSLANSYNGNVVVNGTTLEFFNNASTARSAVASTTPFSWASGDLLYGFVVYEAESDPS